MATFANLATIAGNSAFQGRVDYAMTTAAVAVANEATSVTNHALRLAYAQKIFAGTYGVERAAFAILTNSTIAAEAVVGAADFSIPDSDIQFSANSVFNALAGVG